MAVEFNKTQVVSYSETDANNNAASPNGWITGTFPNQVEAINRVTLGALQRWWDRINGTVTTTGSSGHYIYTPLNTSYPTAFADGEEFSWVPHQDSVGGDDFNLNSLGAKPLYRITSAGPVAISAGDIRHYGRVKAQYDSTLNSASGAWLVIAGLSASGTITAVVAGDGLTGGGSSGSVTLAIAAPTPQVYTSGTGTYTTPAGTTYLKVRMVGGGGGGGSSGSGSGSGATAGGNTTFGTTLLAANGGAAGTTNGTLGGAGGTASLGSGPVGLAISGGMGQAAATASTTSLGGNGGNSYFGGGASGGGASASQVGGAGATNSGGGGGGGAGGAFSGTGGGAGGYVEAIITSPLSTYAYVVGAAGTGETASGGFNGGNGGSGVIIIEAY